MQSRFASLSGSRRRGLFLSSAFVALVLAGLVAARGLPGTCQAQVEALAQAEPGMVLMAGDVSDPACTGKHRVRKARS